MNGLKVAHLSDLHIKHIGSNEDKVLEILEVENPDLICITGDLINFEGPYEPVMSFFHQIKAPYGIYGVLGNTEYSNENGSCILCHKEKSQSLKEKQNPIILRNSVVPLKINGGIVNIVGVDDPVDKKNDLRSALKGMNPHAPSMLLAHSPEIFEEASNDGIDLLLCGHTHGGQIFITRYLRKIFPLESALEFLDGFFQKGKTLMYVSRGLGTSFLPFRLGVKPEITFFTFSTNPANSSNPTNSIDPTNSRTPINIVSISNNPSKAIFTGISLSSFIETFNVLNIFDSLRLTASRQRSSTFTNQTNLSREMRSLFHWDPTNPSNSSNSSNPNNSTNPINSSNSMNSMTLFDFESESDLERLNWECHKWFELSEEHATSGKYSLKVSLPLGEYPGINFHEIPTDWSKGKYLRMDVFNPSKEPFNFHIRIDDNKSGWEYANRYDINVELKQEMNHISIPTDSIRTNIHSHCLNLKKIRRMMVFIPNNPKQREIYIDYIRLE